ncbi:unnamed protein product, partial [Effrenium voratum]
VVTLPECRGSFDVKWSALEGADRLLEELRVMYKSDGEEKEVMPQPRITCTGLEPDSGLVVAVGATLYDSRRRERSEDEQMEDDPSDGPSIQDGESKGKGKSNGEVEDGKGKGKAKSDGEFEDSPSIQDGKGKGKGKSDGEVEDLGFCPCDYNYVPRSLLVIPSSPAKPFVIELPKYHALTTAVEIQVVERIQG